MEINDSNSPRLSKGHPKPWIFGWPISVLLLLWPAGCVDFTSESLVEEFRVLGVQADPPEIAPGQGTVLRVLWVDPKGNGREVSFAWMGCSGAVHASEGLSTCDMIVPPVVRTAKEGGDVLDIPSTPSDLLDGVPEGEVFNATFIVLMCAGGTLPSAEAYASQRDIVDINTLCKGGDALSAFKIVTISRSDTPETNPAVDRLEVDGALLAPLDEGGTIQLSCGVKAELSLFVTEESVESFEVQEFGETVIREDQMFVTWFADGGEFTMTRSGAYDDPAGPFEVSWNTDEPGAFTLYAVAHDMRGGVGWQTYSIEATAH